ncbi:MAG: GCN5-related N-acetyltransferase [uncultured bacterium]|nr:MAG: GCN5-related N-acetyltransferase [uncultured bacterium]
MIIKKATFKDYEEVFKLFCEVQDIHNSLYPEIFKKASRKTMSKKMFKQYIDDKKNAILMAYYNNSPIGYIYITIKAKANSPIHFKPRTVYINHICITEPFRKKGVAKKLIGQIIKLAKSKNIYSIQLDVWGLNENARNSFSKLGFKTFNEKMELKV